MDDGVVESLERWPFPDELDLVGGRWRRYDQKGVAGQVGTFSLGVPAHLGQRVYVRLYRTLSPADLVAFTSEEGQVVLGPSAYTDGDYFLREP